MKLLVLIPARSGSKGLPGKNTRVLGDLPLLGWSAAAAREALPEARMILSTDDAQTAELGKSLGLEAPFLRPGELAGDTVGLEDVTAHLLGRLARDEGYQPDAVLLLQPTSPFRRPQTIRQAVDLMTADPDVEGVLGVKALHRSPALMFRGDERMVLTPLERKSVRGHRRQEVQPYYTPDGTLFLVRTSAFETQHSYYPAHCRGVPTQAIEQLDIDTPADWDLAEAVVAAGLAWR